jgi:hypothetical protein
VDKPIKRILPQEMKNPRYSVSVWSYLLGQYRIQLEDHSNPTFAPKGHGNIIRELCTYQIATMELTVEKFRTSEDPPAYAESLAKPWNCEGPEGRIRLDSKLEDHPELLGKENACEGNTN